MTRAQFRPVLRGRPVLLGPRVLLATGLVLAALATGACRTRRYMEITSDPPGAEVRLDDQSVGLTPVRVAFDYYGTHRVTFYLPGHRTTSRRVKLRPRWYSRFPLDIVTEVLLPLGLTDRRRIHQDLVPGEEVMSLPSLRSVIERANVLRQSGPEGPRALPDIQPSVVPSEGAPEPPPEPPSPEGTPPVPETSAADAGTTRAAPGAVSP